MLDVFLLKNCEPKYFAGLALPRQLECGKVSCRRRFYYSEEGRGDKDRVTIWPIRGQCWPQPTNQRLALTSPSQEDHGS